MALRLRAFRALWGIVKQTDGPQDIRAALPAIARLGYDGVEVPVKFALAIGKKKWSKMLRENDLKCIYQVFSDGPVSPGMAGFCGPAIDGHPASGSSVEDHLRVFQDQVLHAYDIDNTEFVNAHSGNDYWTFDQAEEYFEAALEFQDEQGLEVFHEGHRKRFLHSPWVARDFVRDRCPDIKLTADLSHWINVAETDTSDPVLTEVIADLAPRFYHVHCRVGYDHGPQVADPRAPEWMPYTEGHERWWDLIWAAAAERGDTVTTFTPEHGPPNYQQTLPYTRVPLADIWDVNHWIALRQQERFAEMYGRENTSGVVPSETQGLEPQMRTPGVVKPISSAAWAFPIG